MSDKTDFQDVAGLNRAVQNIWDRTAALWDEWMADEGNLFHIRPSLWRGCAVPIVYLQSQPVIEGSPLGSPFSQI